MSTVTVTLPDGSALEVERGATVEDVAYEIGPGLGRDTVAGKLDGTLVGRWGEKGVGPGKFTNSPHGVWIDHHGDLYVAEVGGLNRLQKFARV